MRNVAHAIWQLKLKYFQVLSLYVLFANRLQALLLADAIREFIKQIIKYKCV